MISKQRAYSIKQTANITMKLQSKYLSTPEGIKEAFPQDYSIILPELTPYSWSTLDRAIKAMNTRHRAWPVIKALAEEGEIAAREISFKLGWLKQTAA